MAHSVSETKTPYSVRSKGLDELSIQRKDAFARLARWAVLKALFSMPKGWLTLRRPEAEPVQIGDKELFYQSQASHAEVKVLDEKAFFESFMLYGPIGFAESYIQGAWETPSLKAVFDWFLVNAQDSPFFEESDKKPWWMDSLQGLNRLLHYLRDNTKLGSRRNIQAHYDLSNDFFSLFLDSSLTYSSAYFESKDQDLEAAQLEKIDLLCRKLKLSPSDHLLEIGTGWGALAIHAAKAYGCRVTTTTLSDQQYVEARRRVQLAGLEEQITLLRKDYRDLTGQYDKLVSVEMLEAVGDKHYESFFSQCNQLLKPDGLMALQVITCPDARYETLRKGVDFIQKHIFPGSLLPSLGRLQQAMAQTGPLGFFELEDMGIHYARTLHLWHEAFQAKSDEVLKLGFDEAFLRKWSYYLLYCQSAFEQRHISVVQAVLTRPGNALLKEAVS